MQYKYIARIIIEATSAFHLGSGQYDYVRGSLVQKDWNGLPYLPGTSIAGLLRHGLGIDEEDTDFGYSKQATSEEDENIGLASNFIFSSALLLDKNNQAIESMVNVEDSDDELLQMYLRLPVRDFVSIDHRNGTAKDKSLHSREMVYKGSRFAFLVEFSTDDGNSALWNDLLAYLNDENTRIGGGSRKGFGAFRIEELKQAKLDLTNSTQRQQYLEQPFSINDLWKTLDKLPQEELQQMSSPSKENWVNLPLTIEPEFSTLIFGAGISNENGDATQKKEEVIVWNENQPSIETQYLLPGSSIKGAIRHRIIQLDKTEKDDTSLDDKIKDIYENEPDPKKALALLEELSNQLKNGKMQEQPSDVAKDLFGFIQDEDTNIGNVIVEDTYLPLADCSTKVFSHVAIDRFTGAPIKGALFQEEVIIPKKAFTIQVKVNVANLKNDKSLELLNEVLLEIADGILPIGGKTNKGHGIVSGIYQPLAI